ncbi:hypothetical protein ACFWMG_28805 [Streptomyces sp. NPDC127074]|uniref:hypothetical protein n=1 Tax=Streptomyces sp. NPDC127074 TaxID=3347130 RepID=UPI00365D8A8C
MSVPGPVDDRPAQLDPPQPSVTGTADHGEDTAPAAPPVRPQVRVLGTAAYLRAGRTSDPRLSESDPAVGGGDAPLPGGGATDPARVRRPGILTIFPPPPADART